MPVGEQRQLYTDFGEYPVSAYPADWTSWLQIPGVYNWSVRTRAGSTSGKALRVYPSNSTISGISWNQAGVCFDSEIVFRFEAESSDQLMGAIFRFSGSAGSENGYIVHYSGWRNQIVLQKIVNGTVSSIRTVTAIPSTYDNKINIRARLQGDLIQARVWLDTNPEPEVWHLSVTDTSIRTLGCTGLYVGAYACVKYFHYVGYGIEGLPAPTSSVPPPDTVPPIIGNLAYDRTKISDEPGFTRCTVTFTANENIQAWEVRKGGAGPGQGTLVESGGAVSAGSTITAYIDWNELGTDGSYEISVYAQDTAGNWTPYHQA